MVIKDSFGRRSIIAMGALVLPMPLAIHMPGDGTISV